MTRQLSAGEGPVIMAHGPKAEYVPTALIASVPGTVAASGSWTSALMTADGYYDFSLGVTQSQAGSITLLRFIDDLGQVALDTGQSTALTAATAGVLIVVDGHPCATFQVKISNSGGSTGTVSAFAALMSAH
jgi:hypothetical protein